MRAQLCLTLCDPVDFFLLGSSYPGNFLHWKLYWNGLPFPTLRGLPNPGFESTTLVSPELAGRFLTTGATGAAPKGNEVI